MYSNGSHNVLFIGAHPDDVELGCGGTIIKHLKKSDKVYVIVVTDGEVGTKSTPTNRLNETTKALTSIGVPQENQFFLHLPDTELWHERQKLLDEISNVLEQYNIHYIYTHTRHSYHQDHITIYEETLRATRKRLGVFSYETNGGTLSSFAPNLFIDITGVYKEKLEMLKFFESQGDKYYFKLSDIEALAQVRGAQSKMFTYAEGFEIIRLNSSICGGEQ